MAHQGGKFLGEEKSDFIEFIEKLEYDLLGMPKSDKIIFLHMPMEFAVKSRQNRNEKADAHESNGVT